MRAMPEDFPVEGRKMNVKQAARHYKTCNRTIKRWAEEVGYGMIDAMLENGARACRSNGAAAGFRATKKIAQQQSFREPEDVRAMKFLQRDRRWVCYSTRIFGAKEVMYHVGNRKLTFDELVALAKQYGFQG